MIVKVKSGKRQDYRRLLEYMLHSHDRIADGRSFVLTHNVRGRTIDAWTKQFKDNEAFRRHKRKNSNYLTHEILSWHKDDARQITPEKLEAMTREYIRLRGIRGMYIAVPHYDRDHYHVHIIAAAIEYKTGKSMRMSRGEFSSLKKDIQQYQVERFPELSHSVVEHGRKRKGIVSEKEYQLKVRTGKLTKREAVREMVNSCYSQSSSQDDFYARLKACKLPTYVRGGRIYGVIHESRKYRFKTLGVSLEREPQLSKMLDRGKELRVIRRKKGKGKERTI